MAGHSQFKNIMHRKGAQDAKRAKIFTKVIREITVAAKIGGGDINANPRLRSAIALAKQSNLPKDRIDSAIKKGTGKNDDGNYEEIHYEGYGPGNVAMIVSCLTDNKNRSSSEVKAVFSKHKTNFGPTEFLFSRVGMIVYMADKVDDEVLLDYAINEGADDIVHNDDEVKIIVEPASLYPLAKKLADRFDEAEFVGMAWHPKDAIEVDDETMEKVVNFIDILEDCDDVQRIWTNVR
jgi:YebC/PmpR family DNA-binding regulatory protein